jgi:hypothetical protein
LWVEPHELINTWFDSQLKATFTEFKDAGLGVLRLELSMAYIKTHWGAHRSQGKVKREVRV